MTVTFQCDKQLLLACNLLTPHNICRCNSLGRVACINHQFGILNDLLIVVCRVIRQDYHAIEFRVLSNGVLLILRAYFRP